MPSFATAEDMPSTDCEPCNDIAADYILLAAYGDWRQASLDSNNYEYLNNGNWRC